MFENKRIVNPKSHYKLEFDKPCPHTRDFSRELGHA